MMMTMTNMIYEPGFWLLTAVVLVPAIQLVAAIWLRPVRRDLLKTVQSLVDVDDLTRADKVWLRDRINTSSGNHLLIASFFAPFAIFGAVALGIYDGLNMRRMSHRTGLTEQIEDLADELEKARREFDDIEAKALIANEGIDPRKGRYWNDPRRREISDLAFTVETWNHPIAVLWIFLWLVLAAPFVILGYMISGTVAPFFTNLWEPLRAIALASASRSKAVAG